MPPISTKAKEFVCDIPGCTGGGHGQPASYDRPTGLGIHKLHSHGIKGEHRNKPAKKAAALATKTTVAKKMGRPPIVRRDLLQAEDICALVLEQVAPNGAIPVKAIGSYNAWVSATADFLAKLGG